jgi:uncharacterized membrane protein YphA (DoxX/SURF4 family)
MTKLWNWLLHPPTDGYAAITLIRLMTGAVFFWEGVLKFVYANQGVGRFTKLGFPLPELTAGFVAWVEILGGLLLLVGFMTRFTAIVFVIEMLVAMATTKISMFLGTSPLPAPPSPPTIGFWAVLHEIRSEYAQLLTCLFMTIVGPGVWSLDAWLARRKVEAQASPAAAWGRRADRSATASM